MTLSSFASELVVLTAKSANGIRVGDQFTLIDDSVDPKYPAPPVRAAVAEVVTSSVGVVAIWSITSSRAFIPECSLD